GQEPAVLAVAAPVLQVLLLVGDVDVATENEFALGFQAHEVGIELVEEAELGLLALFPRGAAGKVAADDGHLACGCVEAQFHVAAFGVELGRAIAHDDVAGRVPRVHGHARIALLFGEMEIALEPRHFLESAGYIRRLGLDLLQANTIWAGLCDPGFYAFAGGRTD